MMKYIRAHDIGLDLYESVSDNYSLKKIILSGSFTPKKKLIFNNISFKMGNNEIVGIHGKNGCGKTSLLSVLAGVIRPSFGRVETNAKILPLLGVGHILHPDLDIVSNIKLWGICFNTYIDSDHKNIMKIINSAEIDISPFSLFKSLSSGMKSRLIFELAMRTKLDFMFLDEIFSVGDPDFQIKSGQRIKKKIEDSCGALIVSHDRQLLKSLCNKIYEMRDNGLHVE